MNGYARLNELKRDLAGVDGTTALDTTLATLCAEVSREFDRETGRHFYSVNATRLYSGDGGSRLYLTDDLLSVTSLKLDLDGDGAFETTVTDYWLWPDNAGSTKPYRAIDLDPLGSYTYFPRARRNVQVVGVFGYCSETEDSTLDTAEALDTSETGITLGASAASLIFLGDTIQIDSEQFEVTSVAGVELTVVRGINGTTAATHISGASVLIRRYPRDVEEAVKERAAGIRWDTQSGYAGMATLVGDASGAAGTTQLRASYARWRRAAGAYLNPAAVV